MNPLVGWYLVAASLGGAVGAVEIFQRYRAEPLSAIRTRWGIGYVVFNGAFAALVFYIVTVFQDLNRDTGVESLIRWSAAAGLGGVALLRTKLMDIEMTGGSSVALGPEIVVQTFLSVIDRELDRQRARARFDAVRRLMKDIDFERSKLRLTMLVFQSMQGVTEEESETLMQRVHEVDEMDTIDGQDKSYMLGFYLMDLVGESFLEYVLNKYKTDFQAEGANGVPPG